jgi:hypothetical protein
MPDLQSNRGCNQVSGQRDAPHIRRWIEEAAHGNDVFISLDPLAIYPRITRHGCRDSSAAAKRGIVLGLILVPAGFGDDGGRVLRHRPLRQVRSTASEISGQATEIFVREVVGKDRLDHRRSRMPLLSTWLGSAQSPAGMEDALAIERPLLRLLCGDRQERIGLRCKIAQQTDHQHVLAERDAGRHYYIELI